MDSGDKTSGSLDHLKALFDGGVSADSFNRKLTDFFPGIIYVYDVDGKKLRYVNRAITDVLGYSYDDLSGVDNDMMQLVFQEDAELVKAELAKIMELEDDKSSTYNCRWNHKSGDFRYFKTLGTVLRREKDGKPVSLLFVAQDITHEMRTEAEIKAINEFNRETEELLQFGTWELDVASGKLKWSDGVLKLLEYERSEVADKISRDFYLQHVLPEDLPHLNKAMTAAITSRSNFEFTYSIITAQNKLKKVTSRARPVMDENGTVTTVLGTTWDITDQYNLYHDLLVYKDMILEKEEFLNHGSWEIELPGGATKWSNGMYRLFGYSESDIQQAELTSEMFQAHQTEEDAARSREHMLKALEGKDYYITEEVITTRQGKEKRLETFGKIIRDSNGLAIKIVGTTRDVTQLRDYEHELEQKLRDLDRSNKELEEFAYVASHDLQEPLRKVTTFGERLRTKFDQQLGEEGQMYLKRMMNSAENMRLLIDNLLEYSRITRKNQSFETSSLDTVLAEVKTELELKIEESKTVINVDPLPTLECIPSQMRQLFNNLISNSIKFRKPGEASLISIKSERLSKADKEQQRLRADKTYFKISVTDNGIGFEEEYAEKIFQIFQRLHGKSEYPGAGIGLAICKRIVDNHNGTLMAENLPGQGARFTIILPEKQ